MIKTPLSTVIGGAFWTPGATVINGAKLSFETVMKKLFANGEQGFWYDPSDMGTMFQDAAGTTPVTGVGQPVGLVLDKSRGVRYADDIKNTGITAKGVGHNEADLATYDSETGVGSLARVTVSDNTYVNFKGIIGRFEITIENLSYSRLSLRTRNTGLIVATILGNTKSTHIIEVDPSSQNIALFGADDNTTVDFKVHSLREIKGNVAYQSTSAARPILQDAPRRIDFDAIDDKLITNLPAQLTGCTVVRAVPGVGVQLLTDQTIPATYEDNTDHCGLIVINRALTPSETSAITTEFNKRAGV